VLFDLSTLPDDVDNALKYYPQSILRQNITDSDLIIPLDDVAGFPDFGAIQVGVELIQYLAVDSLNNNLILSSTTQRGVGNTTPAYHYTDGYDGYVYWDPGVPFHTIGESNLFDNVYFCQNRFEYANYAFTQADGYKQVNFDLLNSDFSGSDAEYQDFPRFDFSGWRRTSPIDLLNGKCVGSYIGGEYYCADGYGGVGMKVRGLSLRDINNQRQEQLLEVTGEPVVLLQRKYTGIRCRCYTANRENPDDRCPFCYGAGYVMSYNQYFNERRSDRRILVRFSPADEDIKLTEHGMESELNVDAWTLMVPTIHDRDIIVRFDPTNNEEFRYEVISVNRNKTVSNGATNFPGAQKMRLQRIRKYDPNYQILAFRDTSTMPSILYTSLESSNGIALHTHTITRNENDPNTWSQLTSVSAGHNHQVVWNSNTNTLEVVEVLGHTHTLTII
jgi:hypothetical protein